MSTNEVVSEIPTVHQRAAVQRTAMAGMSDGTQSTSLRPKSCSTVRTAGKVPSASRSRSSARITSLWLIMSVMRMRFSGYGAGSSS